MHQSRVWNVGPKLCLCFCNLRRDPLRSPLLPPAGGKLKNSEAGWSRWRPQGLGCPDPRVVCFFVFCFVFFNSPEILVKAFLPFPGNEGVVLRSAEVLSRWDEGKRMV